MSSDDNFSYDTSAQDLGSRRVPTSSRDDCTFPLQQFVRPENARQTREWSYPAVQYQTSSFGTGVADPTGRYSLGMAHYGQRYPTVQEDRPSVVIALFQTEGTAVLTFAAASTSTVRAAANLRPATGEPRTRTAALCPRKTSSHIHSSGIHGSDPVSANFVTLLNAREHSFHFSCTNAGLPPVTTFTWNSFFEPPTERGQPQATVAGTAEDEC